MTYFVFCTGEVPFSNLSVDGYGLELSKKEVKYPTTLKGYSHFGGYSKKESSFEYAILTKMLNRDDPQQRPTAVEVLKLLQAVKMQTTQDDIEDVMTETL